MYWTRFTVWQVWLLRTARTSLPVHGFRSTIRKSPREVYFDVMEYCWISLCDRMAFRRVVLRLQGETGGKYGKIKMLAKDDVADVERNVWEALRWDRAGYTIKDEQATWLKVGENGSGIMAVIQGRVLRTIRSVGTTTDLKGSCDHDDGASCQVGDGISFSNESLGIWRDHLARYAHPKKKHEDAWKVHTSRDSVKVGNWIISFLDDAKLCLSVLLLKLLTHRVRNCA